MNDDDDFVRITLRIPRDLHERLNGATGRKRSMNAEIIQRLEDTFRLEVDREAAFEALASLSPEDATRALINDIKGAISTWTEANAIRRHRQTRERLKRSVEKLATASKPTKPE